MNTWTIAGRLGKDAATRQVNGDTVANFSVAVDIREGREKSTLWVDCSLWGKRADALSQYLTKGTVVAVSGQAGFRLHEGKVYPTLRVSEVSLLGGGDRGESAGRDDSQRQASTGRPATGSQEADDEIPY